jgi:hypothetical protein
MRGRGSRIGRWFVFIGAAAALAPGAAVGKPVENHCLTPAGDDLNEVFSTRDAMITPFCTEAHVGDRWRKVLRAAVAGDDFVFPAGYSPSRLPLEQDLLAKVVSLRYVVDAGSRQERTYLFTLDDLIIETGALPDGTRFARWVTPSLHPLPLGTHTVDEYTTLSAEFWDGLGLEPGVNGYPAGESLADSVQFTVVKRK